MGDFNIDTSEKSASSNRMSKQYYLNMLASHGAEMLTNEATRVTLTTATVIDHILTNVTQYSVTPGVIRYDLTNHYPVFVKACNYCNNSRTRHAVKTYRTFKLISSSLSSYHEKATEALCVGRIQTRLGFAFVSKFSA